MRALPVLLRGFSGWRRALFALASGSGRPFRLVRRSDGLALGFRSPLEIWVAMETCLERQYDALSPRLPDDATVVDIGAGIGDFTLHAARRVPGGRVVAYEPDPGSFRLLEANVSANRVRNVVAVRAAVGGGANELRLCDARRAAERSTAVARGEDGRLVPATTLDRLFEEHGIESCDLLKIDCEGGEFDILFAASPGALARIGHICLEYHDDATAFRHDDLVRFLEERGFGVRLRPDPVHRRIGLLDAANRQDGGRTS